MNKPAILSLLCLLPACATTSIDSLVMDAPNNLEPVVDAGPIDPASAPELAAPSAVPKLLGGSSGYTNFKLGYYNSKLTGAGEGEIFSLAFGKYITSLIALEVEAGYFQTNGIGDNRLRGAPIMANGRVNLPLLFFEVYGGVGIGGIYYDTRLQGVDSNDWVWAANAFLGATFSLLDKLQVGIEGKYYQTESAPQPVGEPLEGYAVSLYAGLRM